MTIKKSAISFVLGVGLAAGFLMGAIPVSAAAQDSWPKTSVDAPTPKVPGMPAELAKNLANFDDLDFHVYTGQHLLDQTPRVSSSASTSESEEKRHECN